MKKVLKPGGIVCSQGSTFYIDIKHVKETLESCRRQFKNVAYAISSVPSYPCGQIGYIIGCLDEVGLNLYYFYPQITEFLIFRASNWENPSQNSLTKKSIA